MKFIGVSVRWLLVGMAMVVLYQAFIAQAYIEVLSLLLAILFLIPGLGDRLSEKVPFLQSSFVRSFLGLCLFIFAVASFAMLALQNSEDRIQQHVGLLSMDGIIRAQKFYHLESGQFAASFEELKAHSKNDEAYHYIITVNNSTPHSAIITAAAYPKYRLRSYTGMLLQDEQKSNTKSVICQTRFISQVPPEVPQLSDPKQQKLACPANSESVSP